ncbi:hypothetical protein LWT78_24835, partial [Enterobacter hormaechei]|nr:hypothetical protein [Enterobacter hormaechei]
KPVKPKPHIEPAYQLKARLTVGKASSMKTEYFGYANKLNYSLGYSMGKWEEISNNTLLLKNIIEFDVAHTASTPPNCFVIHVEDNSSKIKEQFGSK